MTDNQIIIEVAKLDGFELPDSNEGWNHNNPLSPTGISIDNHKGQCKRWVEKQYLTSRDAIIPVIEKQTPKIREYIVSCLVTLRQNDELQDLICASAKQLSIALLKATGKWTEK